jgi:O-antigen ligase
MGLSATHRTLFSAFAVALGLSVLGGFLSFLREPPSADFHGEWASLVFFCVAACFIAPVLPKRIGVDPWLLALPVALAVLIALQSALGSYGYWQVPAFWLGYLALAVLSLLLGQALRAAGLAAETTSRIAWALVIAALLNCGAQLVQTVHHVETFAPFVVRLVYCRPYGNLAQANQAATLAWLGIAATTFLYGSRRLPSPLALPMLAVLLVGAALSASRMSWLFLGLLVAAILLLRSWPAPNRRARIMTAALLSAALVTATLGVAPALEQIGPTCVSGLDRLADRAESGMVVRLEIWRQAIDAWRTSPWIGVGAFGFAPTVYAIESFDAHRPLDQYAHNLLLQILAEFGLVGALVLVAVGLVLAVGIVRSRRSLEPPDALLLVIVGIIGIHSMLEFPLWYTYFLWPACVAIGILRRQGPRRAWPLLRPAMPIIFIAGSLLGASAWLLQDFRQLDRLFWLEDYRRAFQAGPTPEVRALMEGAGRDVILFKVKADVLAGLSEPVNRDDLKRKIAEADRILAQHPNPAIMGKRVALAILDNDEATARLHLRRMLGFFPKDAERLTEPLRLFVEYRPGEFSSLGPLLDQELALRPRSKW